MVFDRKEIPVTHACKFCGKPSTTIYYESHLMKEICLELCSEHLAMRRQMIKGE